jgi:hypothetical protein
MTDTLMRALHWRRRPQGLWVATDAESRPMGIVTERWVHGFTATGRSGKDLGTYRSLDEAQAALEAAVRPAEAA